MFEAELAAAHAIADRAGEIALSFFRHDPEVRWKPDATPVTEADLAIEAMMRVTGWQAHARPFAFEPELEYADGIARFLTGTPNVPALYACTPGYDLIEEIGVERIRANSLAGTRP